MKKNSERELIFIDNYNIHSEYDIIKLADTCRETFEIRSIDLPEDLDEKMPLLRKIYPPKKKTLKRR